MIYIGFLGPCSYLIWRTEELPLIFLIMQICFLVFFSSGLLVSLCCCFSVIRSCLTLCDPIDCSMPGFPIHHHLLALCQPHVHWVGDAIQPSCPLSSPSPLAFNLSRHKSGFFTPGSQSIGVSASASVLPMNIQDWFPLRLIVLISLQSKGLSKVFSNTTVQKHHFFGAQPS